MKNVVKCLVICLVTLMKEFQEIPTSPQNKIVFFIVCRCIKMFQWKKRMSSSNHHLNKYSKKICKNTFSWCWILKYYFEISLIEISMLMSWRRTLLCWNILNCFRNTSEVLVAKCLVICLVTLMKEFWKILSFWSV